MSLVLRRLATATLFLTAASCGGGDGPTGTTPVPPTVPTLTPLTDTARVGAMLVVDLANTTVTSDTVVARVGGTTVRLYRVTGATFAAQMPELPAGQNLVQVTAGAATVSTTITVLPGLAIADPMASINASLDAAVAAVPVTLPSGVSADEWNATRAALDSLAGDARAQLAALTPEQRLAAARLLAASQLPPASVPSTSTMMLRTAQHPLLGLGWFKLTPCQTAMKRVVGLGIPVLAMTASTVFFVMVPADPITKLVGTVTSATALFGASLAARDAFAAATITCGIITDMDLQDDLFATVRMPGGEIAASVQGSAVTKRFFVNRPVTQYSVGTFRRLSTTEIAKDALVRQMNDVVTKMNTQISAIASKLPAKAQRMVPLLPTPLGPPGSGSLEAVPPADVRIANVKPASVQLSSSVSGQALVLQTGADVVDDVPFTYDVVSVYDSTIKVTKAGVARPMMSAAALSVPATVTGTRTITTDANGLQYGTLRCGGGATVRVKGGDTAEWRDFAWQITGPSTINGSDPIRGAGGAVQVFESGDYPFNGSWYYTWRENDQPVYKPFTVTIRITYFDRLTQTLKTVTPFSFNCI